MLAAASGSVEAVKRLLDAGADANAKESARGQTALMFAAAHDRVPVINLLASRGADLEATTKIVDLFAVSREEEAKSPRGGSSLTQSAPQAGPDVPARGRGGRGAQAAPAAQDAAPRKPQVPGVDRAYNYLELIGYQGGVTSLHFAARDGHIEAVKALIEAGADINRVGTADKTSPLVIATINGHFDLAKALLDRGADPKLAAENGVTPLYAVLNCQWSPKVNYPQPTAYQQQQTTYLDLMTALLDKGADPNARLKKKVWYSGYNSDLSGVDEIGATPFWRAAYASDTDAMRLLAAHGADPQIATIKPAGRTRFADADAGDAAKDVSPLPAVPAGGPSVTPLHAATGVGYSRGFAANAHRIHPAGWMPAAKYLVEELHVDVNARDADGNTALHHAASRGDNEMILYLISKGADPQAVNREGMTTVDMANGPVQRTQPYPETIALLEKMGVKNNHKCKSC
jgi:ankyrin repeat protein